MTRADKLLRWHGSKRELAPRIVALFPADYERMVYVEPFCGSSAVFFEKKKSRFELLNDRDDDLVNFLLTVKLHGRELARILRLVPNSRALFAKFFDVSAEFSSVMRAARFVFLNYASFGGLGFHWAYQGFSGGSSRTFPRIPPLLLRCARRLVEAQIDCAPWQEAVEKLDGPNTLFYFDPPYLGTERYRHEFTESDWRELRARLDTLKGKFVLSAEGTAKMKLFFRGFKRRLTEIASSLRPNDRVQKELLVWNY